MKTLKKALETLLLIAVIFLGVLAYGSIDNRFYRIIAIRGNSMAPTIEFGDIIVITRPIEDLSTGTIVTMQVERDVVTHRVIGFDTSGNPITKGDANEVVDSYSPEKVRIAGIYQFRIPKVGYLVLYLSYLRSVVYLLVS